MDYLSDHHMSAEEFMQLEEPGGAGLKAAPPPKTIHDFGADVFKLHCKLYTCGQIVRFLGYNGVTVRVWSVSQFLQNSDARAEYGRPESAP